MALMDRPDKSIIIDHPALGEFMFWEDTSRPLTVWPYHADVYKLYTAEGVAALREMADHLVVFADTVERDLTRGGTDG